MVWARWLFSLATWLATAVAAVGLIGVMVFFMMPRLLGWELVVVQGGSMEPALPVGSVMFVAPVDGRDVRVGDIVSYRLPDMTPSETRVTHRVVDVIREEGGLAFRTKGDANDAPDNYIVPASEVLGRVRWHIPWLGYLAPYLRTPVGFLTLIGIPGTFLIISEVFNIFTTLRRGRQGEDRPQQVNQKARKPHRLAAWLTLGGMAALAVSPALLRRSPTRQGHRHKRDPTRARKAPRLWPPVCLAILTLGLVGSGAGLWATGSYALFSDSETSSGNTLRTAAFFEPATISKELIEVNDADGDGKIEVGERVEFTLRIAVGNLSTDGTVTDVVVSDAFGGELEILSTTATVGDVTTSVVGKSEKPFLEWEVTWGLGQLLPGDQAELIVVAATDVNPGGHQEYTEAGPHSLNSGATLTGLVNGKQFSVTSGAIWVEVVEANAGESEDSNPTPSSTPTTGSTEDAQPAAPQEPPPPPSAPPVEYEVQPGDTLIDTAARFGTTVEALVELNGLEDPDLILYGSTLNVPYVGEDGGDASAGMAPWHGRASGRRSGQ